MSLNYIELCEAIVGDHFGSASSAVARVLLQSGALPLFMVAKKSGLKFGKVKKCLTVLIHHRLVEFACGSRGLVEYRCDGVAVVRFTLISRCMHATRTVFGEAAEVIVDELATGGPNSLSSVVKSATQLLNSGLESVGIHYTVEQVKESFVQLASNQYIRRCPMVATSEGPDSAPCPSFEDSSDPFRLPEKINLNLGPLTKPHKRRYDELQTQLEPDDDILWIVNYPRFEQFFRDQLIIKAIENKIDPVCAELLRSCLRLSEIKSNPSHHVTAPLSALEVLKSYLPPSMKLSRTQLDAYLHIIRDDSSGIMRQVDDSAGGLYVVDFAKATRLLAQTTIESLVLEKFGVAGLRMFRILLEKHYLEQNEIEKYALLSPREAKDVLYNMFAEKFVTSKFVPKTTDFAPSRTFYLFYVDFPALVKHYLQVVYKSFRNLILRSSKELNDNKLLLELVQKVESLKDQIREDNSLSEEEKTQQLDEIESGYLQPAAKATIARHKAAMEKLFLAEVQLQQTMFILESYLFYWSQAKPTPTDKGRRRKQL